MTKNNQFWLFLSIYLFFLASASDNSLYSFSVQPPPASFRKLDNRSAMICFSLSKIFTQLCVRSPACYAHAIFVKSRILLFQKDCSSLSFNYGVLKDSSAAFMLANFRLPLIAPSSPDFLIPQNLLSWNPIPLYSCIVRTYILLFSKWVICQHGNPFAHLPATFKYDFFFFSSPSTLLRKKMCICIIISFQQFQISKGNRNSTPMPLC